MGHFICAFGVLWTLIEGLTHFLPTLDIRGALSLLIVIAIGVIYSAYRMHRPSSVIFGIAHTNTKIQISFGDLFCEEGVRCIPVNEFFDSELGLPVSQDSLHGIFLSRCFGGHSPAFDEVICDELADTTSELIERDQGKRVRYPIGATAIVPSNSDRYLCFALSRTDTATLKAEADVPTLWRALEGLYSKARTSLGGSPLVLPLVGSGLSAVDLPARDLLDLIILSIIAESKKRQVTMLIKIILTPDRFAEVDLTEVHNHWR